MTSSTEFEVKCGNDDDDAVEYAWVLTMFGVEKGY